MGGKDLRECSYTPRVSAKVDFYRAIREISLARIILKKKEKRKKEKKKHDGAGIDVNRELGAKLERRGVYSPGKIARSPRSHPRPVNLSLARGSLSRRGNIISHRGDPRWSEIRQRIPQQRVPVPGTRR